MQIAQEVYDSKMTYAKSTHKVDISKCSLSAGGERGICVVGNAVLPYGRGGKIRRGWIVAESWGGVLMNFIMGDRGILGLKASAIRIKVSGVRFFHIVSGWMSSRKSDRDAEFRPMGRP